MKYNVEAQAEYYALKDYGGGGNQIFVHVTDENGQPVSGLTQENFKVSWLSVLGTNKTYMADEWLPHLPGVYRLTSADLANLVFEKGTFAFAVRVTHHVSTQGLGKTEVSAEKPIFAEGVGLGTLVKLY